MAETATSRVTIVLVHGGFVDGSGWEAVYKILKEDGYNVSIVQNPTLSLSDDVAATKRILAAQSTPVILVGHSYGGVVITEAGNDSRVAGLVYIAAFAPDKGESVAALIKDPPAGAPVPPILPPQDGFLSLDRTKFAASFAADVAKEKADFMANSQVPWGVEALNGTISEPAWKTKPSWYLIATEDKMIPPPRPAFHVQTGGLNSCRGRGQPRGLRVEARIGGRAYRNGRQRCEAGGELDLPKSRRQVAQRENAGVRSYFRSDF
jgi:pimeloyl-ACP methyl ester carboxylesterase